MVETIIAVLGFVLGVIGAATYLVVFGRNNLGKQTISLMEQNKKAQDDAIFILQESDKKSKQQISNLAGHVQVLKDVPLASIAKSLETIMQTTADLHKFMITHETGVEAIAKKVGDDAAQKIIDHFAPQLNDPK